MQDSQRMQIVHSSCNVNQTAADCVLQQGTAMSVPI